MTDLTDAGKNRKSAKDIAKLEEEIAKGKSMHAAQNAVLGNMSTRASKTDQALPNNKKIENSVPYVKQG